MQAPHRRAIREYAAAETSYQRQAVPWDRLPPPNGIARRRCLRPQNLPPIFHQGFALSQNPTSTPPGGDTFARKTL